MAWPRDEENPIRYWEIAFPELNSIEVQNSRAASRVHYPSRDALKLLKRTAPPKPLQNSILRNIPDRPDHFYSFRILIRENRRALARRFPCTSCVSRDLRGINSLINGRVFGAMN
jgi:hypothetical protein